MVADGYEPLKVTGDRMSDNFFQMLGVRAALGRTLEPGDSQPGRTDVLVISAELFERHFGSNPRTIGQHGAASTIGRIKSSASCRAASSFSSRAPTSGRRC